MGPKIMIKCHEMDSDPSLQLGAKKKQNKKHTTKNMTLRLASETAAEHNLFLSLLLQLSFCLPSTFQSKMIKWLWETMAKTMKFLIQN